ncbi:MAG: Gfo/Idh/MocA family oxidoreductase [Microbacteriaceae bacterium]
MLSTPASGPVRVGLIGYGLAGRVFHAPFIAANPALELSLIATADPARARQAGAAHPGARVVPRPEEVIGADVDLVVIASPVSVHCEQAGAALAAGHSVVIDKPFVPTVAEGRQLIAQADAAGLALIVFHNRRWDGDFLTVRSLVETGRLGAVHRFESAFERWSGPVRDRWQDRLGPEQGAGIAYDLGSHLVDQALQLFGPAEVELAEFGRVRAGAASEDDAFIALRHTSGTLSHLSMSHVAGVPGPRFRVLGSAGAYRCFGLDPQEAQLAAGLRPGEPGYGVVAEDDWGTLGSGADTARLRTEPGDYSAFYAGVARTVREGAPASVDAREALEVVRIIERAHEVARIRSTVA